MQRAFAVLLIALLGACAPPPQAPPPPTVIAFPTMTLGAQVRGPLPTPPPDLSAAEASGLTNPATAVALASMPTPTPNYTACPLPQDDVSYAQVVETGLTLAGGIAEFLSQGGALSALEAGLDDNGLLGETGFVRNDIDLTGEGTPEFIVSYDAPGTGGTLLVLSCANERVTTRYQASPGTENPEVLRVGDMNFDQRTDLLFTAAQCSEIDGFCEYQTGLITWSDAEGGFVNLLSAPPDGDVPPTFGDLDGDNVLEIVMRQDGDGDRNTGPIRTGSRIYDWNGSVYTLSLPQPDPIRYVIQAVHEADRAFRQDRMDDAARVYLRALEGEDLRFWFDDEPPIIRSYILYRLLLTFTFAENGDPLQVYEQVRQDFPEIENAPVYAQMAEAFWFAYQESNNLNTGCLAVAEIVQQDSSALGLINRYGTRSPSYAPDDLCPF